MMSKLKNKKTNIATLSSSSSTITTLPTSIPTKTSTPPLTVKEKRRLQQRRNSSSPVTRINYETNLSFSNKTEFTITNHTLTIPIDTNIKSTNSTTSLNSDIITNSPGQYRRSRIPVIINSPSRHNSRRSLSARLRTNSNNISTTLTSGKTNTSATNNSDLLLFTSPPTFRKRISSSLSRDSSPGGVKYFGSHYYFNNNFNSSHCYIQQQQQQQQQHHQYKQQQLNEQKLLNQYQLKKQQQLQYNENKIYQQQIQQQHHQQKIQYDFKGYSYNIKNNKKGKHEGILTQHLNKTLITSNIEGTGAEKGNQNFKIKENIKVNEKDKINLQFSECNDIIEMSSNTIKSDKNNKIDNNIENVATQLLNENNVNNSDITISKPTNTEVSTTKCITENTVNNMASKMDDDDMKVISKDDENLSKNQNEKNLIENLDNIIDKIDETLNITSATGTIIKNDDNQTIFNNKIIPNGSCIVENQTIKCPNGCCPKPSCSPISPIAEEEESGNILICGNNILKKNINISSKNNIVCCMNSSTGITCISSSSQSSPGGVKIKRDSGGMTLNLNAPSTSNANNNIAGTSMKSRTPITPKTPHTPKTPSRSNCPSLSTNHNKITPKTPPVTPDSYNTYIDDDLDSVYSYSSGRSTMSCDHPYVARNGTTFSGRKMKYVVHCSAYAGQVGDDYLTPTQRAQRQLRRLKELLTQARQDLEQKDSELLRLTREVVELRLFKASLSSPEDPSNSSDAVTVREAPTDLKTSQDVSPIVDTMMLDDGIKSSPKHVLFHHSGNSGIGGHSHHHHHHIHHPSHINNYNIGGGGNSSSSSSHQTSTNYLDKISNSEMQSSFADSGHFEDMTTSHSTQDQACGSDNNLIETYEEQRAELIRLYEKKIEELIKNQDDATGELKKSHNDRIEALLQKLADINTRYADIVPDYEQAKERIRELEKQLEDLQQKLLEHEETQKKMYLHMYQKGQEAERIARAEQIMEIAHRQPNRVSIPELLQQLQSTQDELENIRVCNSRERGECALLTAKEAISLWVLGARKTIYRRLIEAQQNKQKVDPEITLQFLKSAIYYFLTDKENSQGHLNAIESILEFSEQEKEKIHKARTSK